jgi:membrane associated rhomboid family serine protease
MFPYRDDNPTLLTPWVTLLIIAANLGIWGWVQGFGMEPLLSASVCRLGLIPGELLGLLPAGTGIPTAPGQVCLTGAVPAWHTAVTSMFLHGGWFHLIGNMWFLWVFGNNVEDSMGHGRFVVFYLLCGLAAAAIQVASDPSGRIPMVGASGAISGIMGAYVLLYPRVRVRILVFLGIIFFRTGLPAWAMLGYWFLLQLAGAAVAPAGEGGVAFWAHAGGFVAGVALIPLFRDPKLIARRNRRFLFV